MEALTIAEANGLDPATGLDAPTECAGSERLGRARYARAETVARLLKRQRFRCAGCGCVVEMGAATLGTVIVDGDGGGASTSWPCVLHSECLRASDEVPAFRDLQEWAAANMPDELDRKLLVDTMLRVVGEPVDEVGRRRVRSTLGR